MLIGNWKLNHSKMTAGLFFDELLRGLKPVCEDIDVAIAPVATMLDFACQKLAGSGVSVAAQNVFYESKGAFTGEWSAEHLQEIGVSMCLVGHSERRQIFHESDQEAAKKARACLAAKIMPVCCLGETLAERDQGHMTEVIGRQLRAYCEALQGQECEPIFAYEPVWAIGTGRSASADQAQEAHVFIRAQLGEFLGAKQAHQARILYGGSVTPQNISELVSMPDVDGALVGGASLQVASFLAMVMKLP